MRVTILPISGGAFPIQLAILKHLCSLTNPRPDVVLASSGGNVAAYITAAADWSPYGIRRIVNSMHEELFLSPWTQGFLSFVPSMLVGYFKGTWYNSSKYGIHFFNQFFTEQTIQNCEIWSGTVDCASKKAQIFCNRSHEQAIIKEDFDCKVHGILPAIYLNGKVEDIATVALASASIPTVVPPQKIRERLYADGGVIHASPLTCMKDILHKLEDHNGSGLHLTYINCFDMQKEDPITPSYLTSVHNGKITMMDLVHNLSITDRSAGIDLMRSPDLRMHFVEGICVKGKQVQIIEEDRLKARRSFVEYFPCSNDCIDLKSFDGKDIGQLMDKVEEKYLYRIWWLGDHCVFDRLDQTNICKTVHPDITATVKGIATQKVSPFTTIKSEQNIIPFTISTDLSGDKEDSSKRK